jgi:cytoskeletal protein CcmA (bactofilin family)
MRHMDKEAFNVGKSVVFKGELSGSEDLVVEGTVEGKVELREHVLTVGSHGKLKAEVFAKIVIVLGEVVGNITASEKVELRESGSVDGDVTAPRVGIAEGAHLRGSVDMQKKPAVAAAPAQAAKPDAKLAPLPAGAPVPGGPRVAGA